MKILWVGESSGISGHKFNAAKRLGHNVELVDPRKSLGDSIWFDRVIWRFGGGVFEKIIQNAVIKKALDFRPDICFFERGELIGEGLVKYLKNLGIKTVNFNNDDPFGGRDGKRFSLYMKALPHYDLCVVVRDCNYQEAISAGAKNVMLYYLTADDVVHDCRNNFSGEIDSIDLVFVGTWMPERGAIIKDLVEKGMPISVYGPKWNKSPEFRYIKNNVKLGSVDEFNYCNIIRSAKVVLGLLSVGNRDEWTSRSAEVPYLRGVLLAPNTGVHDKIFHDVKDLMLWSDIDDFCAKCEKLLSSKNKRDDVKNYGRLAIEKNKLTNINLIDAIISKVNNL